ncbi:MAG: zinc-binding dehydrogenase [Nitrospirae bacterium]|nr:zinc-binding dehydrogenase [Nitrospirota bacterium]
MKAVVFHQHGGPERLRYEDVEPPRISPHEALIRVKACALNHLDIWIRQGIPSYQIPLPHISGCDVAGVLEEVGQEVAGFAVGDRVFASPGLSCWRCEMCLAGRDNLCPSFKILGAQVNGGYAELVKVPVLNVIPIPGALTFEQAAAFPLVSVTAWHMLFSLAGLRPGEEVLVMGAGSGVGSVAVQMAKLAGARVITTVGSDEKLPKAKALGADEVINHAKENVMKQVKSLTDGRGVDVVIEHIGPEVWDQCLLSLARGGRLVTCGATTGGEVKLDLRYLFSRQLTLKGSYMGTRAELVQAAALMGQGRLKPVVDQVFPLKDARAAQERMLSRAIFGKLVLAVT